MNRLPTRTVLAAALAVLSSPVFGQTHKVAPKPQDVVRAVGVYEWTGDMAKPTASRLIPVSIFINSKFQDAAVYLARPVPLALLTGNVYELQKSGKPVDLLDIAFSRHFVAAETSGSSYDDGWFGYGKIVPPAAPKPSTLHASNTRVKLDGMDNDDDRPHFSSRSAQPGSGGSATNVSAAKAPDASTPADDPDRPTLHRASSKSDDSTAGMDDPDRPTLRKHSSAASAGTVDDVSTVKNTLNDDPNRPKLHYGKPMSAMNEEDIPKLSGLPAETDLHQMVAVSDAANRPEHDFALSADDDSNHAQIQAKLEDVARQALTAYEKANDELPHGTATAQKMPPDTRRPNSKMRRGVVKETPAPAPEKLEDEQLRGFMLSYGATPTYVFHAHTDGLGTDLRFVTVIAQLSASGEPQIVLKNVTDASHLDRTPRFRLVDAVDADASNRASLLFELRAKDTRQFALYRVLGGRADQLFITGSTQ